MQKKNKKKWKFDFNYVPIAFFFIDTDNRFNFSVLTALRGIITEDLHRQMLRNFPRENFVIKLKRIITKASKHLRIQSVRKGKVLRSKRRNEKIPFKIFKNIPGDFAKGKRKKTKERSVKVISDIQGRKGKKFIDCRLSISLSRLDPIRGKEKNGKKKGK